MKWFIEIKYDDINNEILGSFDTLAQVSEVIHTVVGNLSGDENHTLSQPLSIRVMSTYKAEEKSYDSN